MARSKIGNPANQTPKAPRRPHNARKPPAFRSVDELTRSIGAEPRSATLRGKDVVMSQAERMFRLTVDSALKGNVSNLLLVIRTMVDRPQIAGSAQERWVLFLAGADAEL